MTRYLSFLTAFCCGAVAVSTAQGSSDPRDVLGGGVLTRALVIASAPGYPEVITVNDPIEASIVNGSWKVPVEGMSVQYNDTSRGVWELAVADSQGWFDHPSLRNGYAYVQVRASETAVLILEAGGHTLVYVNGVPRSGNPYLLADRRESWEPGFDYSRIPVRLKKGWNDLLFQCSRSRLKVKFEKPERHVFLNTRDLTIPDFVAGRDVDLRGSVVVVNAGDVPLRDLAIITETHSGVRVVTPVPLLQPLSLRKAEFRIKRMAPVSAGVAGVFLRLVRQVGGTFKDEDTATVTVRIVNQGDCRKETIVSSIDGSVQYYAVNPARGEQKSPALFISLHGAGVEAINQASSYTAKSWGHIVAPTNRRPYGYNWEDWGRLDALEVLDLVKREYRVDNSRVYLTGHSMGGHGTYHLGSLFPDRFAALGPSAGWISFWTYRVRQKFIDPSPKRQMVMRGTLASDTYAMAQNFRQLGMYILHGDQDDNVLPDQSRMMVEHLKKFHTDFVYHEQHGAGHWWDNSDEPGADCVDWGPMFDFFARHARPEAERVRQIDFATPNPGISATCNWVGIEAQQKQLMLSSVNIRHDPGAGRFIGSTANVARLTLDPVGIQSTGPITVELDSQKIAGVKLPAPGSKIWLERREGRWVAAGPPSPMEKGPHRYGTFKDVIRNRVIFVYGTRGNDGENRWAFEKARFDAERFWYQGNGSIDVVADVEFNAGAEPDRNVVIYGSAATNAVWGVLLSASPVQVHRGKLTLGSRTFTAESLGCVFIRPRPGSSVASVGVVSGTGLIGMRLTNKLPYFLPGVGLPDCLVLDASVLTGTEDGIRAVGCFGLDWSVESGEFIF